MRRIGDRIEIDLNAEGKRQLKVGRMAIAPVTLEPDDRPGSFTARRIVMRRI
jgi:hypothetical protein